jgi:hypothetical protein
MHMDEFASYFHADAFGNCADSTMASECKALSIDRENKQKKRNKSPSPPPIEEYPDSFTGSSFTEEETDEARVAELRGLIFDQVMRRGGIADIDLYTDESDDVVSRVMDELRSREFLVTDKAMNDYVRGPYRFLHIRPKRSTDEDFMGTFSGFGIFGGDNVKVELNGN